MSHRGRGRSGSSDHHRGYSGGGGRGAAQASSAPLLSSNRSFRRSGNGQGQQQQQQARVKQSSQGVMPRNNADASRRERATGSQRGLIPSPNNHLQTIHKAERKYEVGKVLDKEEAKQRQLRAILNKLTPQNFARLFQQVMEVNIDSIGTLMGLVSQIFDRALLEPTFCALYVNLSFHLAGALPDITDENDELITFRRLLLNKCQEEFERGEREQTEAEKVEEEREIKQSEQEREEKRLWSRRRMLGNIRLIGELFKGKMLTERIIHECVKKLLGQYQSPDEEDIEALCILMATIGEMIDHSKAKVHIDAYFDMMHKLSTNDKISSRVRFMLRDSIDLRTNKWQQKRKIEGPRSGLMSHRRRRRSGSSSHHRGYSGGGGRGPAQASSAPLLSSNRSFRSLGYEQGQQQQAMVITEPAPAPVVVNARPVNRGTRALSLQGLLSGPMQSSQGVMPQNNADASRWERATGFLRGLIPSPNNPLQGILSGPMQPSQGVMPQNNADASRWERATGFLRGLIPSPNNPLQGNFTRDRPVLDISSSSSSGEDEMEEWLVGKKNAGLLASTSSVKERDEDEECVIMDSNLLQTPVVDFEPKSSISDDNLSRFQDEEIAIISERGHVACRDYPHSRHHCAKFPFNKTTHESCCPQCYCYVCDRVAPCKYWKGSSGHCNASDEDPKWKGMRMFHRGSLAEVQVLLDMFEIS